MKMLRYILIGLIVVIYLLHAVIAVLAINTPLPLGARCRNSHECEPNMGCRPSERGDFKVCKLTIPGGQGCASDLGENMCADGLVCQNNRCKPTFGLDEFTQDDFRIELEPPGYSLFKWPKFLTVRKEINLSTVNKVLNLLLAVGLLVGLTLGFKGLLVFQNAFGFIPQQRRGLAMAGIGGGIFLASLLFWLVI